jgi:predicted RNA binding protein YcfA (HicA-like mRNA interferase family)
MHVSWKELKRVCQLLGCTESRQKGDHLVMVRPGLARPIVIKMDDKIGEDIVRSNMRTLGVSRKRFLDLLSQVRGHKKRNKSAS